MSGMRKTYATSENEYLDYKYPKIGKDVFPQ